MSFIPLCQIEDPWQQGKQNAHKRTKNYLTTNSRPILVDITSSYQLKKQKKNHALEIKLLNTKTNQIHQSLRLLRA